MDSNHRRHSQQIYSLPHLANLVTTQKLYISKASAKVIHFIDYNKNIPKLLQKNMNNNAK